MRRTAYIFAILLLAATGCGRMPGDVIRPGAMAELLADLYVADGVVDQNPRDYRSDSAKLLLRQSIFARHGVSNEQFDTSLVWYGHHMDQYIEVYDNTIALLQERDRQLGSAILMSAVSMSGDSVDVWGQSRFVTLSDRFPSQQIRFALEADDNWQPGDVYTWRVKVMDEGVRSVRWNMLAEYADSTNEWLNTSTSTKGWNEAVFPADSTKELVALRGFMEVIPDNSRDNEKVRAPREIRLDSITLTRKRVNEDLYRHRQRLREYKNL